MRPVAFAYSYPLCFPIKSLVTPFTKIPSSARTGFGIWTPVEEDNCVPRRCIIGGHLPPGGQTSLVKREVSTPRPLWLHHRPSSFHNRTSGSKIKCPAGFQREDRGKVDGLELFYVLWNRVYFQSLEIGKIFSKQEHESMFEINPASGGISSGSDVDREVLGHPSLASHAVLAQFSPVQSPCLLHPFYCCGSGSASKSNESRHRRKRRHIMAPTF